MGWIVLLPHFTCSVLLSRSYGDSLSRGIEYFAYANGLAARQYAQVTSVVNTFLL